MLRVCQSGILKRNESQIGTGVRKKQADRELFMNQGSTVSTVWFGFRGG